MAKLKDINLLSVGHTINLTGAVWSGEGKTFITYFPGDREDLPIEPLDMDSEDWKTFIRQTDLLETEVLAKSPDGTLAKIILRKSQRQLDLTLSWKVFKRDGYRCRYCGNDNTPMTVDHLVVWEEGGPTIEANLVASCKKCNKTRGNMPYLDWLQSPHYRKVSAGLDAATKQANSALALKLVDIPRMVHARSR